MNVLSIDATFATISSGVMLQLVCIEHFLLMYFIASELYKNEHKITFTAVDPAAGYKGGGKKHEIYVPAFGDHLSYDLFLQGRGDGPLAPRDPLLVYSTIHGRAFHI